VPASRGESRCRGRGLLSRLARPRSPGRKIFRTREEYEASRDEWKKVEAELRIAMIDAELAERTPAG